MIGAQPVFAAGLATGFAGAFNARLAATRGAGAALASDLGLRTTGEGRSALLFSAAFATLLAGGAFDAEALTPAAFRLGAIAFTGAALAGASLSDALPATVFDAAIVFAAAGVFDATGVFAAGGVLVSTGASVPAGVLASVSVFASAGILTSASVFASAGVFASTGVFEAEKALEEAGDLLEVALFGAGEAFGVAAFFEAAGARAALTMDLGSSDTLA